MSSPAYPYTWPVEHDNNDDASLYTVVAAAVLLARLKSALANKALVVNPELPFPRQTGQQWLEITLRNEELCLDNLRMSPDDFLHLHDILHGFGLKSTRQTGSMEILAMYVRTCAHHGATREGRDRFVRSLDTISRKVTHVAEVMQRWADTIIVPYDITYAGVKAHLRNTNHSLMDALGLWMELMSK